MKILPKLVAIVGPTASGKTNLALKLARQFNGEVISADSRQIYRKMTIGTAKPNGELIESGGRFVYIVEGIPHYLMDILNPDEEMSAAEFKTQANLCIQDIIARGKLPILVGGTGQYIWVVVDNLIPPNVAPQIELRNKLAQKNLSELQTLLKQIDPKSYLIIDLKNPRRIIRALEVALTAGKSFVAERGKAMPLYNVLQIGLNVSVGELNDRIEARVEKQLTDGLAIEVKRLLANGYDLNLPSMSSIGYSQIISYLKGNSTLPEAIQSIKTQTKKYAKRQRTWFRRDNRIQWVKYDEDTIALQKVKEFLDK